MSYGELLKTAFAITRRNRYLWFFGLFAGAGASFNVPTGNPFAGTGAQGENDPLAQGLGSIDPAVIVAVVGVAVLLLVVYIVLSLIAQGALTDSVAAIDRGGERRFGTAWKAGIRSFWRVLGFAALVLAIFLGIVIVVGGPLVGLVVGVSSATEAAGARIAVGVVVALVALAALVLVLIPFQVIAQLALRELLLRGERPVDSLRRGYRLFRAHLGPSVLLWVIQLGIGIGAAIVLIILIVIAAVVVALPVIGLVAADVAAAAIVVGVAGGLVVIALSLVAFGALGTFIHAYWTLAYLRLDQLEAPAT